MFKKIILFFIFSFLICACSPTTENKKTENTFTSVPLSYAKRFAIKKSTECTVLELLGNKDNVQVTATFVLYNNSKPNLGNNVYYIKTPVKRVASMSSIYTTMLEKLHCEQSIVAIDNVDYYTNTFIQQKVKDNTIIELSRGPQVEIEKTIALNPDLFLTFGMGSPKNDVDKKCFLQ